MGRRFTSGHGIRRVIHSMFHLVTRTDELFAIGTIQENGSVRGGTGWGVELGKLFNRKVHVYDQDRGGLVQLGSPRRVAAGRADAARFGWLFGNGNAESDGRRP